MAIGESWGRTLKANHKILPRYWANSPLPTLEEGQTMLPYGLGRSYGDSCLNDGGVLIPTGEMKKIYQFDREKGIFRAEAGICLADILQVIVPEGWFLPVVPGTKFITLAGAIANDIHGKITTPQGPLGCMFLDWNSTDQMAPVLFAQKTRIQTFLMPRLGD